MRRIFLVVGMSIALFASVTQAGGDNTKNVSCVPARPICRVEVEIKIDMSGNCTAIAPAEVKVERQPSSPGGHTLLVFVLMTENADVAFAENDGIKPHKSDDATRWKKRFDSPVRQERRVLAVKDKNHWFSANEKFEYDLVVMNGVKSCDFPDPLIHNTY